MKKGIPVALIESLVGQANILSIPREVIRFFGDDIEVALLFCQLLLCHGKSGPNGIAKTYQDWHNEIGLKIHKVRRIVRELTEKGLIKTRLKIFAGRPVLHFQIEAEKFAEQFAVFIANSQKIDIAPSNEVSLKVFKTSKSTDQLQLPSQSQNHPPSDLVSKETSGVSPHRKNGIPYAQIIEALNRETGSRFRDVDSSRRHISARWSEGFRVPDFEKVIANMVRRWKDDPKMEMYLRPQTLFGTKFQSYLNAREGEGNGHTPKRTDGNRREIEGKYTGLGDTIEV